MNATSQFRRAQASEQDYARRFGRVFDFIDRHLGEGLSLDRLSRVARFSRFHFHRQFASYAGITLGRYIQLARLRRASYRLAFNPLERITDIALEVGFEQTESFSRAFRQAFGQSPTQFRQRPDWAAWSALFTLARPRRIQSMQVRVITVPTITVAVLEHRGDPALLNDSVQKFITWRRESGLSPVATSATYGVAYDDPQSTPPADFRFDLCGSVEQAVPVNRFGVITKSIPGGRCAVVRHEGSLDDVASSVYHLYRHWLPTSGEQTRGFPVYFRYLNLRQDTPEHELQTDVHLPIK